MRVVSDLPTLYKMDSKGKIRSWHIQTEYIDDITSIKCGYWVTYGEKDGKLRKTYTAVSSGKNIGRANETSIREQAESEARSAWNRKKDRAGYTQDLPTSVPFRPMLAKDYHEHKDKIDFPCFAQPKLDGIRCTARLENGEVVLRSRQNKKFTSLDHLKDELETLFLHDPYIKFDGELYCTELTFQQIKSAVKRDVAKKDTKKISYHIYDNISDMDFEDRKDRFTEMFDGYETSIVLVETVELSSQDEIIGKLVEYQDAGYEGIILRNKKGPYRLNTRSADLQKYKNFIDQEFEIVGAKQNKGMHHKQCCLTCKTPQGDLFDVKPKGTEEEREQYWIDYQAGKLKGKMLTVKFFEWTTGKRRVPRFPVGLAVRDYE